MSGEISKFLKKYWLALVFVITFTVMTVLYSYLDTLPHAYPGDHSMICLISGTLLEGDPGNTSPNEYVLSDTGDIEWVVTLSDFGFGYRESIYSNINQEVFVLGVCDHYNRNISVSRFTGHIVSKREERITVSGKVVSGSNAFGDGQKTPSTRVFHMYEIDLDDSHDVASESLYVYICPYDYSDILRLSIPGQGMYINIETGEVSQGDSVMVTGAYIPELYTLLVCQEGDEFISVKNHKLD